MSGTSLEPMDVAAPAEPEAAAETKPSRRRRIPTSVVVTVLGIGLSAWLLPAFTRQWDDRQKANELKASLVADMASATARALSDSQAVLEATLRSERKRPGQGLPLAARIPVQREWSIASFGIQAKLRAYFSPEIVDSWRVFNTLQSGVLVLASLGSSPGVIPPKPESEALKALKKLDTRKADAKLEELLDDIGHFYLGSVEPETVLLDYQRFAEEMLILEEQIASQVLTAHPTGYSTTWRDLLRDLVPVAG